MSQNLITQEKANDKKVLGILNLTPDSFSDGDEQILQSKHSLGKALSLISAGVDVLDIGAESTRPGASEINSQEELRRLETFMGQNLEQIKAKNPNIQFSIDTRQPETFLAMLSKYRHDIHYLNDVSGMQNPKMIAAVMAMAKKDMRIIVMHSKGEIPPSKKATEIPDDYYGTEKNAFLDDMKKFFEKTIRLNSQFGIKKDRLILDPGLGFGKNLNHSLAIPWLCLELKKEFDLPVLIGASRKSFLKIWDYKIEKLGFDKENLGLEQLDKLTEAYHQLFEDNSYDYVRLHL